MAGPLTLVVVDDNEGILALVRSLARTTPRIEVVGEAVDGREAIGVVGREQPDAVLLDLHMPNLDGFDAIPAILSVAPRTCILAYTSDPESYDRAMLAGAHDWLMKSTPWNEVALRLQELVETRGDRGKCQPITPPWVPQAARAT